MLCWKKFYSITRSLWKAKAYEKYAASKYPNKKLAILSCMDTRLTELLPAALGLKNGDAKIIKNAGGIIADPFGSVMRMSVNCGPYFGCRIYFGDWTYRLWCARVG